LYSILPPHPIRHLITISPGINLIPLHAIRHIIAIAAGIYLVPVYSECYVIAVTAGVYFYNFVSGSILGIIFKIASADKEEKC
jgi:uncharacterized membrane protein